MNNRIVISKENDPYYNLALEEELFRYLKDDEFILYLWQNKDSVIIGRNQNPYAECDFDFINKNNIKVVRRISGGGAVFHDLGNLNFTFLTKEKYVNLEKQLSLIKLAIESLGLKVEFSGRNDVLINGKKFSGHAFYNEDGNYFHHGTIMVDVNCENLIGALKASKLKLKSKGIESIRSRVINLNSINKNITIENVKNSMEVYFEKLYGYITEKNIYNKENKIPKFYCKYADNSWNCGESPNYNVSFEEHIDSFGNIQVDLEVENGKISSAKMYSDTLKNTSFKEIEKNLEGRYFLKNEVLLFIKEFLNKTI